MKTTRDLYAEAWRAYRAAGRNLLAPGNWDLSNAAVHRMRLLSGKWDIPHSMRHCPVVSGWGKSRRVIGPWLNFKRYVQKEMQL